MRKILAGLSDFAPGIGVLRGGSLEYFQRLKQLFGSALIGYWPLWEPSGTAIENLAGTGNGEYQNSPDLGQPGIGDGKTSVRINNAVTNQHGRIFTSALESAFNSELGTMFIWAKCDASAWTDGANRVLFHFGNDGSLYYYRIMKTATNNTIQVTARTTPVAPSVTYSGFSTTNWFQIGISWNLAQDRVRMGINGVQYGVDTPGLLSWGGSKITLGYSIIGAQSVSPSIPWKGWLAHAVLLNVEAI